MNKQLNIPLHQSLQSLDQASEILSTLEKNDINISPWNYKFDGKAQFSICHDGNTLYIKFLVSEKDVVAKHINANDPVYKDSCVEFFIAYQGDEKYYNLEFNSAGTCLAQYGASKLDREFLAVDKIRKIKTTSSYKGVGENINWELTVAIPKEIFSHHHIDNFSNQTAKANFYKCGDDLPNPHFLCWNPIQHTEPNFHLPQFFGDIIFEN